MDTARERRAEFAEYYGIPAVYDHVEDMLSHDISDRRYLESEDRGMDRT